MEDKRKWPSFIFLSQLPAEGSILMSEQLTTSKKKRHQNSNTIYNLIEKNYSALNALFLILE